MSMIAACMPSLKGMRMGSILRVRLPGHLRGCAQCEHSAARHRPSLCRSAIITVAMAAQAQANTGVLLLSCILAGASCSVLLVQDRSTGQAASWCAVPASAAGQGVKNGLNLVT